MLQKAKEKKHWILLNYSIIIGNEWWFCFFFFFSFKLSVLKAQMCMKRYCMFLEPFQIPSCQPLVSAWRYWMSEGMWSTSCLFYFMAFLKDIKHVFIPEFNKTQIILAKIELFPRLQLNHVERARLAEALLDFQWNSSSCLTLTDAQPCPRPKLQPGACVRKHLLHSPAQKHIYRTAGTFWLRCSRNLDRNPLNWMCSHQLPWVIYGVLWEQWLPEPLGII